MKPIWQLAKEFNRESRKINGETTATILRPSELYKAQKEQQSIEVEVNHSKLNERLNSLVEVFLD